MTNPAPGGYWLTRVYLQRSLAFIYVIGFLIILYQYTPLVGENGILPIDLFLQRSSFASAPSLFWFGGLHHHLMFFAWAGLILATAALLGLSDAFHGSVSAAVWTLLWLLYLSFNNVGQLFYGFGWESILLETGFLAIFLGSSKSSSSGAVIWLFRWILFRVMFGAGLIKLRGDSCWTDLTCMMYHYETQPLPNPLSWYFHKLPMGIHKFEVLFTHFAELIVPFGYFIRRPICYIAGGLTILFQVTLILSGNLSWLNYMTIVLCIACFDDRLLSRIRLVKAPQLPSASRFRKLVTLGLVCGIGFLSINPVLNMLSKGQMMNASFNALHLVNTYGAFGSVTRVRREVVLEGTHDTDLKPETQWTEYEFKCKPGDVSRMPCVVSPYHLRLDWQIWFAAMSPFQHHPWILNLAAKLLKNDEGVLSLLDSNPFAGKPPKFVRAALYEYRFTTFEERQKTGDWWVRKRLGLYLAPLSLDHPGFRLLLLKFGWRI